MKFVGFFTEPIYLNKESMWLKSSEPQNKYLMILNRPLQKSLISS